MENINTIKIIWFRFPFFYRLYNFFCLYSFSETSEINTHECQSVSWAWEENVSDLFQCPEVTQTMFFSNPSFHINIFWCLYLEGKHNLGPWMSIFSMKPDFSFYIELKKKKKKINYIQSKLNRMSGFSFSLSDCSSYSSYYKMTNSHR